MRPALKRTLAAWLVPALLVPAVAAGMSAGRLADMDVENPQGESIGEIEDLVVDVDAGRVLFAVLEIEGIPELRGKRVAFPIGDFAPGDGGKLVLDVARDKLRQAKAFDNTAWPAWDHPYWASDASPNRRLARSSVLLDAKVYDRGANVVAEIEDFSVELKSGAVGEVLLDLDDSPRVVRIPMSALSLDPKTGAPMLNFDATQLVRGGAEMRVTRLVGMEVRNRQGEVLGEVEDLVVDVASGRVAFAVLEYDAAYDPGTRLFAYRLGDFAVQDRKRLVLDVDPALLKQARGFEEARWPAWSDPYWSAYRPEPGARPESAAAEDPTKRTASAPTSFPNVHLLRARELIGKPVRHREGDKAGRIADLIADTEKGVVTDVIVDVRNSPRQARLPLGAFSISVGTGELTLNLDRAQLLVSPF